MALTKELVKEAAGAVPNPAGQGTLGSAGAVQRVAVCEAFTSLRLAVPGISEPAALEALGRAVDGSLRERARAAGETVSQLIVEFADQTGKVVHTGRYTGAGSGGPPGITSKASSAEAQRGVVNPNAPPAQAGHRPIGGLGQPPSPQSQAHPLHGVRHAIAVGAGKGGVGKSTVAVNLAVGLARRGHAVGLMDGDIYGPSMPTMLGLDTLDAHTMGGKLQPFLVHGVKSMTIGKLVDAEKPLIWRGPMAHGAFKQLVEQTEWGELDYLVIDLPPGTGDVPLTMAQLLQLTGAVVVCTPQKVAQDDAVRATRMFQQLGIDVLGVVENMSYFIADDLTPPREYDIFGRGGAEKMAARLGVPFLGAVPITTALRVNSDRGDPSANFKQGTALAGALEHLVEHVERQVAIAGVRQGKSKPTLTVS
jgi:ATP-binding protein involved in chromosome partitioning